MANTVTGNPLVLDTVGAVSPFQNSEVRVRHIEYVDYAVATELFEVDDAEGRIVFRGQGNVDFSAFVSQEIGWIKGLVVVTLTAPGRLLVYI